MERTREFCLNHKFLRSAIIKFKDYRTCRISTIYDYCKEHDGIIKMYDDSCEYPARPLCKTREEFENNILAEPVMRPSFYIYVSRIKDAVIFGCEDFMLKDDVLLSDRKPQRISQNFPEITDEYALVKYPKSPEVINKGISLIKVWSSNYYHFSFEALARLQLVDAIEEYRSYPLIIDEYAMRNLWNIQLLEMVNTYNHPVITVKYSKPYLVHDLIYPSFMNWGDGLNRGYAPKMHTKAADYLREHVNAKHEPSKIYHNVYIARGDNKRLTNESEIIECLKRYGFEIIPQGADNYSQTLDAFQTADNIIGTMGANMSNTVYTKPEANIYIICPFEFQYDNPGFAVTDASQRTLHFISADVHKLGSGLNASTFSVKIEKIEALAKKLSQ